MPINSTKNNRKINQHKNTGHTWKKKIVKSFTNPINVRKTMID